jgi:hypothetical protein
MTTTTRQRQILVKAIHTMADCLDDMAFAEVITEEMLKDYGGYDDRNIGGESRNSMATLLRIVRQHPEFRSAFHAEVEGLRKRMARNPREWGIGSKRPRYHAKTVTRKSHAARHHADCQYCGSSWAGEVVCGACHEQGIDGKVIPGTSASKGTTYITWVKK